MIDEKKMIEDISKEWEELVEDSENYETLLEYVIKFIKCQPKIGEWIPCSKRLPETRNNILICQNDGYVSVGYYSQGQFLDLNSYPYDNIIAWRPLPEAYHEQVD